MAAAASPEGDQESKEEPMSGAAAAPPQEAEEPGDGGAPPAQQEARSSEEDLLQEVRRNVEQRTQELLARGPEYLASRNLNDFNAEAAAQLKAGEPAAAAATYCALFAKARQSNVTHPELYICHSNCSAAFLKLGLYSEALKHADQCQLLAEASLRRNFKGSASYVKSFLRKGQALMGLGCNRDAAATLDKGLQYDPFNLDLKLALERANQAIVKDLVEGRGRETKAIEYPEANQRISYHPYSAPLHRIKTDDMLPLKLLTPFQAENDHHIKDTYNYVTVQSDIRMPKKHLRQLEDAYVTTRFRTAIEAAVQAVAAEDKDCRVLNLGAGAGLHAMLALRAGAHHVTAAERWLYLALACKDCLVANEFPEERYKVLYKRPTDLKLKEDVPVCCNLLIANVMEEGLLTSGLLPCMNHALGSLLTTDAILMPSSATVYMQAVELRTTDVCGLDMSAANLYRWRPAYAAGVPLDQDRVIPLSKPKEVWHFDLGAPPDKSEVKSVDLEFTKFGRWNVVMFWYKLHLFGDVWLSTGPQAVAEGLRCLQPAVQYIAGELPVDAGMVLPLVASHNTVRMRFDVESAEFLNLHKPDAAFPHCHFAMLADEGRCQAYQRAIERAVQKRKAEDGEAHVLDIGCGTGVLSLLAARGGAKSVVACDLHASVCDVARKAASVNGLSARINVVPRDVGVLQRGKEVRALGVNIVIADVFDAGLLGSGFPYMLELAKRKVVQPGASVVPAGASLYCMGVEALTGQVAGLDMSPMNNYRWDASYEAVSLDDLPYRRLTKPIKVFEQWFDGIERKARGRESMLKLEVVGEGVLNAVVFWFDLHLDDKETITNAPEGIGEGGVLVGDAGSSSGTREGSSDAGTVPAGNASEADGAVPESHGTDATATGTAAESEAVEAPGTPAGDATEAPSSAASQHEEHAEVADGAAVNKADSLSRDAMCSSRQGSRDGGALAAAAGDFNPATSFDGARPGYAFKLGDVGLGYYLDAGSSSGSTGGKVAPAGEQQQAKRHVRFQEGTAEGAAEEEAGTGAADAAGAGLEVTLSTAIEPSTTPQPLPPGPRHYWGQALQYLDRAVPVAPGRKVALLARREEGKLRFTLRQGVGEPVGRAPWKIEWGGGSSVENPHYQRVHYCRLLVTDFLQRVKSKRFPPIEKDMRMVLAHCGSLLLDPASLEEVAHELIVLERLHQAPDFSPAASLEAMTHRPLRLC